MSEGRLAGTRRTDGCPGRPRAAVSTAALIGVGVLLLLGLSGMMYRYLGWRFAFNSDDLYCDALCEDILHGRDLGGQHFPGAPYLFPDLLLLLPCHAISGNLVAIYSLYLGLFFLLMLAALTAIVRELGWNWKRAALTAAAGLLLFVAAHLGEAYQERAILMAHSGNHLGASLAGLALLAVLLRSLRAGLGWLSATGIVVLCALGTFSDRLLVIQYILPAALALGVLALRRLLSIRRCVGAAAALGAGTLLARALYAAARALDYHFLPVETLFRQPSFADVAPFFRLLLKTMERQDLLLYASVLHLIALLAVLLIYGRNNRRLPGEGSDPPPRAAAVLFLACVVLFSLLGNLAALFGTGMAEQGLDRYSLPRVLFSFVLLGVFLQTLPGRCARWASRLPGVAAVLLAVCRLAPLASDFDLGRFRTPYPPLARAVDELVRRHGPLRGLAGFWTARRLSFLTRNRVVVRPLHYAVPWLHADNPNLFLSFDESETGLPRYDFIVLSPSRDESIAADLIARVYGEPAEKIPVGADEIWLYPDGITNPWFRCFLHAQLASRLRKQRRFLTPMAPAELAVPKANFTPAGDRGNVWLEPGETLEIRFGRPVSGRVIDLAAHFTAEYLLCFYLGAEPVGTMVVSVVPWTGRAYEDDAGLQARLLSVPASLRGRRWDRVLAHPVRVAAGSCIGHFLVYEEDVPGLCDDPGGDPYLQSTKR